MSSAYSSYKGTPRCQRCSASLALKDPRCTNCGYYNGARPATSSQQPPVAMPWNQQSQPAQHEPIVSQNQPGQEQGGRLLKRYLTQMEQRNRYTSPASFQSAPQPQTASRPVSPSEPFNVPAQYGPDTPRSIAQPPQVLGNGYAPQTGQLMNNGGYRGHGAQSAPSAMFSQGSTAPPSSFRATSERGPSPVNAQAPRSFYEEPRKRRRPNVGRIIGIVMLLIGVIGGSLLTYTFLFAHKNTQQTVNATTSYASTPTSVPQGNPLFQDEFTNNTNGWSIQSYPNEFAVGLGNGALKLENDSNKLLWELVPGGKTYGDFQISVDAILSKGAQGNGYGIYIRGALSQNTSITAFYRFELYGDGSFAIFKGTVDTNGATITSRLTDYTNSSAIEKQGRLNHMTINARGSRLQFTVNSQILSTVTDATYSSGSIALFVSNLQKVAPGAEATFSHLAIYPAQT